MANSFSVMDMLNKSSREGNDDSPKARFRTKDIPISKMYRNEMNFYKVKDIESLAKDIKEHGLMQNLEVVHEPCKAGEYRIISGERRWEALKILASEGLTKFEIATCRIVSPHDPDEEQIEIISANSYRTKCIADILEEEKRLKLSLERLRENGRKIEGYDLKSGKTRDIVASKMGLSSTKIAQIESINNNLIAEFKEELTKERITFSAAYELSGMEEPAQKLILESYKTTGSVTHKEVKDIKKGKAAVGAEPAEPWPSPETAPENVSDSDTSKYVSYEEAAATYGMERPEKVKTKSEERQQPHSQGHRQGDDYETPHPESITSLCYSCKKYSGCNVKTGTCKKCDQYINKAEAEKTDEQKYYEEQERMDRETRKKLREIEDEEKMERLPSDTRAPSEGGSRSHKIRLAVEWFDAVCSGKKNFELRRNDRGYKIGDILEMEEFGGGIRTGRGLKAVITYILEDYTGLEEGYCILAIEVLGGFYWIKDCGEQKEK